MTATTAVTAPPEQAAAQETAAQDAAARRADAQDAAAQQPAWAARPVQPSDHPAVLDFFTEPDFHFRTPWPDTRPEWEVLALLDEDTRLLTADGVPVGLYAVEQNGAAHACHAVLHLRLTARMPLAAWAAAYRETVRALRMRREVIRLSVIVGAYDARGLAAARLAAFDEEGELPEVVVRDGKRHGLVFFSTIWEPTT